MKIVADENIDLRVIEKLREYGFDVISIRERERGSFDPEVLFLSHLSKALLVTEDKDFGNLVFKKGQLHFGVLLIRVQKLPRTQRIQAVFDAIVQHRDALVQAFSVLTPAGVRIRYSKEEQNG